MNETDAVYPIAILVDELKHEDLTLRLNAVRRLSTIALALGADRTRAELIPFLDEAMDDEDEVLAALASELADFTDYVGGVQHAAVLLGPIEQLATQEETVVRDKAAFAACSVCRVMPVRAVEDVFIPMLRRLASGDWFAARVTACALHGTPYARVSALIQDELRKSFHTLCNDDTPMVRRAAAAQLPLFVPYLSRPHVIADIVPATAALAADDQDSVRLLAVPCCVAIATALPPNETRIHLLATIRSLATDKSWRVRYNASTFFVPLAKACGPETVVDTLVSIFTGLLKDSEPEVKTIICAQLPGFAALLSAESVMNDIMPAVKLLIVDPSLHVRASIALYVTGLASVVGKSNTIEHLLPLFLQLLKDEASEVRLNIISKLEEVNKVVGIDLLSQSLVPAIIALAEDKLWRVRLAIIENIPLLASQLGVVFFDEKLSPLCMAWLGDCVFSIRDAATQNLRKLTTVFGGEWARKSIIPKITILAQHSNYLYRMTTVFALLSITQSEKCTPVICRECCLPTLLLLATDPIPNIRFNVAKALGSIAESFKNAGLKWADESIKPVLVRMRDDTDEDVKYFSGQSLGMF